MTTLASSLLDFILNLLRDPVAAKAYAEDPNGMLAAAGLHDVSPEDVEAVAPMVADYGTVGWGRKDDADGRPHTRPDHDDDEPQPVASAPHHSRDDCDRPDDDSDRPDGGHGSAPAPAAGSETVVITHLQQIQKNEYTDIEIDASHSIWVTGDSQAIFGEVDGDVQLVDDGGVAVGGANKGDIDVDNSETEIDVEDSFNVDDSFNEVEDGGVVGDGNHVGNTSVDLEDVNVNTGDGVLVDESENVGNTTDSFNTDTEVGEVNVVSGEDNVVGNDVTVDDVTVDRSTDLDVDVEDSFNGNTVAGDDVDQSSDDDVEVEVEVDDSLNGNTVAGDDVDQSTEIEDSFTAEDSFNPEVEVEDAAVAVVPEPTV